ncbi:hypothetical protein Hanom_Chr06g00526971 [Helianthus anomalus]
MTILIRLINEQGHLRSVYQCVVISDLDVIPFVSIFRGNSDQRRIHRPIDKVGFQNHPDLVVYMKLLLDACNIIFYDSILVSELRD